MAYQLEHRVGRFRRVAVLHHHREAVEQHRARIRGEPVRGAAPAHDEVFAGISRVAEISAPAGEVAHHGAVEAAAVRAMERGHLLEVAFLLEAREPKPGGRAHRQGVGEGAELARHRTPSETRVTVQPFGEQQRNLETLALHRGHRQTHQSRAEPAAAMALQRVDRTDAAQQDACAAQVHDALEDLRGRDDPAALAGDQAQLVAKAGIVIVVTGEEIAVAVPRREQVEHLVAFAAARGAQFHGQRMLYWSWTGWPPRITVRLIEFWLRKLFNNSIALVGSLMLWPPTAVRTPPACNPIC